MTSIITWFVLIYALLVALGGVMGYAKVQSNASLISGLVSGVVLAIAWYTSLQNPLVGLAIATVVALLLLGVFALRFRSTAKFMPAGLMAILSLGATVAFAIGWVSASGS
ncbi:MAG: TMEM14 family protein [Kovacikia sp.]